MEIKQFMKNNNITRLAAAFYGTVLFFICFGIQNAYGQIERKSNPLNIQVSTTPISFDNASYYSQPEYVAVRPQSFVSLKVDENSPVNYQYRYTLGLKITPLVPNNSGVFIPETGATVETELVVEYNPFSNTGNYNDLSRYHINDRQGISIEITSISLENITDTTIPPSATTPQGIELRLGFVADNEARTLATTPLSPSASVVSNTTINMNWNPVLGAKYYELEWTWLDSYSSSFSIPLEEEDIPLTLRDFQRNNTRIQTTETSYKIPHIYDKGFLMYRVRAVGVFPENPSVPYHGDWSFNDRTVSHVSGWLNHKVELLQSHENDKNWQFQASYAEDGKKKEVVSYFDGTLRNRQTVTRINSDDNAIVGEVIYDNQGRPAIEVLPVPASDNEIRYYEDFNISEATNTIYNHIDFDWDKTDVAPEDDCEVEVKGMSTIKGASKYYGPTVIAANDDKPFQAFVPDAEKFPFSQIEYTSDNTGRIRRKSGVGIAHKLGEDHEMKYYYFTPTQEELNRLFGYRVGNASHYKKNMVIDPNGQVSVSYIDPQGRTIATALSGEASLESGLETLELNLEEGEGEIGGVTTDLLNKLDESAVDTNIDSNEKYSTGNFGNLQDALRLTREIGVSKDRPYLFDYTIVNAGFELVCGDSLDGGGAFSTDTTSSTNSFPFKYDLVLTVTDDCGVVRIFEEPTANEINALVEALSVSDSGQLKTGTYTVHKDLRVNKNALNTYADDYVDLLQDESNACYVAPFELNLPDTCNISCVDCVQGLGNKLDYIIENLNSYFQLTLTIGALSEVEGNFTVTYNASSEQEQIQVDSFANGYATEWKLTLEACNSECGVQVISTCEIYSSILEQDIKPGGQYGTLTTTETTMDALSVFNENNRLRQGVNNYTDNNWRFPIEPYTDDNGAPAEIRVVLQNDGSYLPTILDNDSAYVLSGTTQDDISYTYVLPQHIEDLEVFLESWEPNWAKSLVGYHPEYQYLAYQEELCNIEETVDVLYTVNGTPESVVLTPSTYDDYLRIVDTYAHAELAGLVVDNDEIREKDPFFALNNGIPSQANTIMTEAIVSNYENAGGNMLYSAYAAVKCNGLTTCNVPNGLDISALNTLSPEEKDRVWQQYKSFYLSLKSKLQYLLMNAHVSGLGYYNGCILGQNPDGTGGVPLREPSDVINNAVIGSYNVSINIPNGNNQICSDGNDAALYAKKEKRFIPIDAVIPVDLTNGDPSTTSIVQDTEDVNDAIIYLETGKCPNLIDLELFLNGFVTQNDITNLVGANTYEGQYLTSDLYDRFRSGAVLDAIEFIGTINSTNNEELNFELTGAGTFCDNTFTLNLPQNGWNNLLHGWNNYGDSWLINGFTTIYFNGVNGGENTFSILAKIQIGAQEIEAVFTGSTCVALGNCEGGLDFDSIPSNLGAGYTLVQPCTLEEDISTDFTALLNALITSGHIFDTTAYNLEEEVTYSTGILPVYYDDNLGSVDASWTFENGNYVISIPRATLVGGSEIAVEITPVLTMTASQLQAIINNNNFESITSINFLTDNDVSQEATLNYLNVDGTTGSIVVTFSEEFDFSCCIVAEIGEEGPGGDYIPPTKQTCNIVGTGDDDQEARFEHVYELMLNSAIQGIPAGGINGYSANVSQHIDAPSGLSNTPFRWEDFFTSYCESICEEHNSSFNNANMVLNGSQIGGNNVPTGTIYLYFDGSLGNGVFALESGIEDFENISEIVYFDVKGGVQADITYRLSNGEYVEAFNRPFRSYAGCEMANTYLETQVNFCELTWELHGGNCTDGNPVDPDGNEGDLPDLPDGQNGRSSNPTRELVDVTPTSTEPGGTLPCGTCVTQPIIPVSCTTAYQEYLAFMDFQGPTGTEQGDTVSQRITGVSLSNFYETQFCNLNLQYLVAPYIQYIEILGVTSVYSNNYLSLAEFGNTNLQYGYNGINDVINAYANYYVNHNNESSFVPWNAYVNTIYLKQHAICPPAALPAYYPVQIVDDCEDFLAGIKETYEAEAYQALLAELREKFIIDYLDAATGDAVETLDMRYTDEEYQYTLYYYDQAGNLTQTVPPQGVKRLDILNEAEQQNIDNYRNTATPIANIDENNTLLPQHNLETQYRYNSLNQLVWQQTPDGGVTRFAYDDLGRIIASQNAGQDGIISSPTFTGPNASNYIVSSKDNTIANIAGGWNNVKSVEYMHGNGYLERTLDLDHEVNRTISLGLSYENTNLNIAAHRDMAYNFYTYTGSDGKKRAIGYANGAVISSRFYKGGETLKIERRNGEILYYMDTELLARIPELQPGEPLRIDLSIAAAGRRINGFKFVDYGLATNSPITYNLVEEVSGSYTVTDNGKTIDKNTALDWNRAHSAELIQKDGYVERTTNTNYATNHGISLGLGYVNSNLVAAAHVDVDYQFYTYGANQLRVYANGAHVSGAPLYYTPGDVLRVERKANTINYYVNGVVVASINEVQPNVPMRMDLTMRNTYNKIENLQYINLGVASEALDAERFSYTYYDGLGRITEAGEIRPETGIYRITDEGRLEKEDEGDYIQVNGFNLIATIRKEVTRTIYDKVVPITPQAATDPITNSGLLFESNSAPLSLRNRVAGVLYFNEIVTGSTVTLNPVFDNGIFYNYDIHGNVKELVHYYTDLFKGDDKHLKRVDYDYDLISGNVERVTYQKGKQDQFIHQYTYDADNRITAVQTSKEGYIWEEDATYQYYDHGPLARMELGDKKVQGSDYVYTLQGWLKSVNGEYIEDGTLDFGKDGTANSLVARDAFSYSLGYYNGDYKAVGTNVITANHFSLSNPSINTLYNGNISQMVTSLREQENTMLPAQVNQYGYDQLNRIKSMTSNSVIGNNVSSVASYNSSYSYDRNGNLDSLKRSALRQGAYVVMDDFTYNYTENTNKLTLVKDTVDPNLFTEDIDDQEVIIGIPYDESNPDSHNYVYDEQGQLIKDRTELLTIQWRVDGKVDRVLKYADATFETVVETIIFSYDGLGNRISKTVMPQGGDSVTTRYTRDAQGNVLGVFETIATTADQNANTYSVSTHKEHHVYGSSRLGIEQSSIDLLADGINGLTDNSEIVLGLGAARTTTWQAAPAVVNESKFGIVNYNQTTEFNFIDRIPVNDSIRVASVSFSRKDNNNVVNKNTLDTYFKNDNGSYIPIYILRSTTAGGVINTHHITTAIGFAEDDVLRVSNISVFSTNITDTDETITLKINNTTFSSKNGYLLVKESQETTPATTSVEEVPTSSLGGSYGTRFQLRQLQYSLETDQNTIADTYVFDGTPQALKSRIDLSAAPMIVEAVSSIWEPSGFLNADVAYVYSNAVGDKSYELSNHLGNVLSVVSDKKIPTFVNSSLAYFNTDIKAYNDYYPFGILLPGRHANTSGYRYGFQGQEMDNEIKGEGNSLNYTFRMHDPRVGRFFAVDPLFKDYPHYTPYSFSGNKVTVHVELEGKEERYTMGEDGEFNYEGVFSVVIANKITKDGQALKLYFADDVYQVNVIRSLEKLANHVQETLNAKRVAEVKAINNGVENYNKSQNIFYIMYALSPIEAVTSGGIDIYNGDYTMAGITLGLALLELDEAKNTIRPLLDGELGVDTYRNLVKQGSVGDNLTPHHIPSANHMKKNHNVNKNDGIAIMMEQPRKGGRHRETFTYGNKADEKMSSRGALARGIMDARRIYQKYGLYDQRTLDALREVVRQNKEAFPKIFEKID